MSVKTADLKVGDMLIFTGRRAAGMTTREVVIESRKETDDGWWVAGGGGIADLVFDDPRSKWVLAS